MTHSTISKLKSQSKPTNPAKESFTKKQPGSEAVHEISVQKRIPLPDKEKNLKKNGAAGEKEQIEGLDSMFRKVEEISCDRTKLETRRQNLKLQYINVTAGGRF